MKVLNLTLASIMAVFLGLPAYASDELGQRIEDRFDQRGDR